MLDPKRDPVPGLAEETDEWLWSTHPEAGFLDLVADCLFAPWQVIAIKHLAHLLTAVLIDHAFDRLILLEHFLDLVGGGNRFQSRHNGIAFAGKKQREEPVMATDPAIKIAFGQRIATTSQRMDHQRKSDLIEPRIKLLTDQCFGSVIANRQRIFEKFFAKDPGTSVEEIARVEIEIAPPVFVGLRQVEGACKIETEPVVERLPDRGIAGAV